MYDTRYIRANRLPLRATGSIWQPRLSRPCRHQLAQPFRHHASDGRDHSAGRGLGARLGAAPGDRRQFRPGLRPRFGVPDAVNSGRYGIGIVIDFFGLVGQGLGLPGRVRLSLRHHPGAGQHRHGRGQPRPNAARAFIEFLLSPGAGGPARPQGDAPAGGPKSMPGRPRASPIPSPTPRLGARVRFDNDLSGTRYELLNSLFDRLISFRLRELTEAWKAVHTAEAALARRETPRAAAAGQAQILTRVPVTEAQTRIPPSPAPSSRPGPDRPAGPRQAQLEEGWDRFAVANYAEAAATGRARPSAPADSPVARDVPASPGDGTGAPGRRCAGMRPVKSSDPQRPRGVRGVSASCWPSWWCR